MQRAVIEVLTALLIAAFIAFAGGAGLPSAMTIAATGTFGLLVWLYMAAAEERWRERLGGWAGGGARRAFALPLALLALYAVYALVVGSFTLEGLLGGAVFLLLPLLLVWAEGRVQGGAGVAVALAAATLPLAWSAVRAWPLDATGIALRVGAIGLPVLLFALLGREGRARSEPLFLGAVLFVWYTVEFDAVSGPSLPPQRGLVDYWHLAAIVLFLYLLLLSGRLEKVGYTWRLSRADGWEVLVNFALFGVLGIPFGLATGFIAPSRSLPSWLEALGGGVAIAFFIALPEEILFRGTIHRYLQRVLGWEPWRTLLLSSVVFGAAHLDNPPKVGLYFILATVAGIFYGRCYLRTGKVTAAAGVHWLVDWVWSVLFAG